ncbi:MAG: OmpH family outer membrane protein [Desulfobacterales bacterium]|nr:MAG: OmpH family outer membrane protein [Desulfobacterales bacterium]
MKAFRFALGISIILALGGVEAARAADVAKIGVIDLQRVLDVSSPGKAIQAELKKKRDTLESDLKKKGEEIEKLRERLEREAMVMSKDVREEKEREGRIKLNDFKELQKRYRADLQQLEKKLMNQLRDDITELVDAMGKKEGYLLIINTMGVMYAPNSIDITDKLIQQLNAKHAKKGKG